MNKCKFCGNDCKKVFCSISCRNKFWNPSLKKGIKVKNNAHPKDKITEQRICKCGKVFEVMGTINYLKSAKSKQYCSRHCANHRDFSEATKLLKSNSAINHFKDKLIKHYCKICNKELPAHDRHYFCSLECKKIFLKQKYPNKDEMHSYRLQCKFRFNPFKYSEILNIDLLKKYGFYSPSNKKNNLAGASLDHKYSIRDGFDNKVDSYFMSHIMNCQILLHSDNISKGKKSIISLAELYRLVNEYDSKRGVSVVETR